MIIPTARSNFHKIFSRPAISQYRICAIALLTLLVNSKPLSAQKKLQIAFIADIHLHDIYADFSDGHFKGLPHPDTGRPVVIRSMNAQLHSTRLFNENYFALRAALDDVARRHITLIALPGDYTDDGQPYNLSALSAILAEYRQRYGMQFFFTTGNHDPVKPFGGPGGKPDFLGSEGEETGIYSTPAAGKGQSTTVSAIREGGYDDILNAMKHYGAWPQKNYRFWATPFSMTDSQHYRYEDALKAAPITARMYKTSEGHYLPDLSYVAEPVEGLWLLAIDGNTYMPKITSSAADAVHQGNYSSTAAGYNAVLKGKRHLLSWIRNVATEANRQHKILIAFSHYPAADYNDGTSAEIRQLLGPNAWQPERIPQDSVAAFMAGAGIRLHFAGHMHLNDTGVYRPAGGEMFVNIQVPSIAAYPPAYKILTIHNRDQYEVQTAVLKQVKHYNDLFPLYRREFAYRAAHGLESWHDSILKSRTYLQYTRNHLSQLTEQRFIPSEWPADFPMNMTLNRIRTISGAVTRIPCKSATVRDAIHDLYLLQSGDELAFKSIPRCRLQSYESLYEAMKAKQQLPPTAEPLRLLFGILHSLTHGEPSGHFIINFKNQTIKRKGR